MKLETKRPNMLHFMLRQEPDDADFEPLKVVVCFDSWMLSLQTPTGTWNAIWGNGDRNEETFAELLSRMSEKYLLNRLSDPTQFDAERSRSNTIARFKQSKNWLNLTHDQRDTICAGVDEAASKYSNCSGAFYAHVSMLCYRCKFDIDESDIALVYDFPESMKKAVRLFMTYVQPEIRTKYQPEAIFRKMLSEASLRTRYSKDDRIEMLQFTMVLNANTDSFILLYCDKPVLHCSYEKVEAIGNDGISTVFASYMQRALERSLAAHSGSRSRWDDIIHGAGPF